MSHLKSSDVVWPSATSSISVPAQLEHQQQRQLALKFPAIEWSATALLFSVKLSPPELTLRPLILLEEDMWREGFIKQPPYNRFKCPSHCASKNHHNTTDRTPKPPTTSDYHLLPSYRTPPLIFRSKCACYATACYSRRHQLAGLLHNDGRRTIKPRQKICADQRPLVDNSVTIIHMRIRKYSCVSRPRFN
ncbi:hypothetical protein T4E_9128 [Trichinella pseudospiralis]|uniref:Uncharacterized protein n=1 Tax=Trichinella pseudospiralis TaxID=6337 RepID=A0A0V0Y2T2_TRIPS|nr:hypothetical protein T4E_9128 [Trichinella pseudospiralis]